MIVDHSDRLHQRIANCRSNKLKAATYEIAAHRVGFRSVRRHLTHSSPAILLGLSADETPKITIEASKFFSDSEKCFRILNRGGDLQSVPHNSGINEESLHVTRAITRDFLRAKVVERFAIILAFLENRRPAQSGLRAFKSKKFKELSIVMHRHAPFSIVIRDIWLNSSPGTAWHLLRPNSSE